MKLIEIFLETKNYNNISKTILIFLDKKQIYNVNITGNYERVNKLIICYKKNHLDEWDDKYIIVNKIEFEESSIKPFNLKNLGKEFTVLTKFSMYEHDCYDFSKKFHKKHEKFIQKLLKNEKLYNLLIDVIEKELYSYDTE